MADADRPPVPPGVISFSTEHTAIKGTLQTSKNILEALVERLNKNEAEVDEGTIIRWKAEIVELVRAVCIAQYKDKEIDKILGDTLSLCMDNDFAKVLALDDDEIVERTLSKLDHRASTFDPLTDKTTKEIIKACSTQANNDDEDLFIEGDTGLTESKIKCPVSCTHYKNPLKK